MIHVLQRTSFDCNGFYQFKVKSSASDSGLSSPSSSLDKHENMVAKPLSSAPPRSRPKSQYIPRQNNDKNIAHRLSLHTNYDNMVVDNNPQAECFTEFLLTEKFTLTLIPSPRCTSAPPCSCVYVCCWVFSDSCEGSKLLGLRN